MSAAERHQGERETEVVAKPARRRFSLEYKRRIVRAADGCKTPGAVGALLRREGLYSSHLAVWRAARERGEWGGAPKKRGPVPRAVDPRDKTITAQAREIARWKHRAGASAPRRHSDHDDLHAAHPAGATEGRQRVRPDEELKQGF